MRKFLLDEDFVNTRLDKWFKKKVYDVPQSFIEKNLRRGNIKINKKKNKSSYKLQKNDQIIVSDFKFVQSINKRIKYNYKPTKKEFQQELKWAAEEKSQLLSAGYKSATPEEIVKAVDGVMQGEQNETSI